MPEGDVVWRTARRLHRVLAGQRLEVAQLRWPDLATTELRGRTVLRVTSRGKHLLTRLDAGLTLHSHLRMDGSWHILPATAWPQLRAGQRPRHAPGPTSQVRAVLGTADRLAVGYRLGMLDLVRTDAEDRLVGHLGPDLLDPDWDGAAALRNLRADPSRTVGEALLDQRVTAGIGTFYLAETCFLTGVSPWGAVADVPDAAALLQRARALLLANRERTRQTTTGDTRRGENTYVYDRAGRACRRCGSTVVSGVVGIAPSRRLTYACPRCQPGAAPTPG